MKSFCFLAAVCMLLAAAVPVSASQFSGLIVTKINIQDDHGRSVPDQEQITALMAISTGELFSADAIRQGIKYIYLTGKFSDVRVDGFPDGDGVRLLYTLVPATVVDLIVIRGNHSLSTSRIMDTLRGAQGRELREDKFPDYRTGITTLYQSEGYYGTGIDFKVEPLEQPHHAVLRIYISEPKPTIIADINFSGNTVFTRRQLLSAMKSKPGKTLNTDILFDQDLAAILEKYTSAGYPAAKPGPVNISFLQEGAYVLIGGKEGPRVSVAFSGNHAFSDKELRKQVLIWEEHDISDAILDSSADKIKNLYKQDGYDTVKVAVRKTATDSALEIVFEIEEGPRIAVENVTMSGNSHFSTDQIKGELGLRESGWFTTSPFRQELLDKGVEYLRERYFEAGFLSAQVKYKVTPTDGGRKANIQLEITEGPPTVTGTVRFQGNQALADTELLGRINLKPGDPYNERLVDEDRYRILAAYSDKGYLYARVEAEKKPADGSIDILYRITEDLRVTIGTIVVHGNERTKEGVIRRELLLKPGDPYNYEKILKSQQRIYRFGYFNLARFEPVHPGEKESVKDMLLSIEERPAGAFEVGVGYGDLDRARASLEVSHRNLWGLAHYGGVRFEKSDILTRSILNYQHPWFFGYDLQGKFALTWSTTKHINSDTRDIYYETRQASASYGIEKKIEELKISLTYAYENVENFNVEPGAILSDQDVGRVRVSSISPAAVWDLRDDIFNPRRGALYSVVVKQAMHQLGSGADFTKAFAQSSWYVPVSPGVITAFSAKAGMAWPHYETTEVPLHERFYLGGNTTIRGYTQDAVGPLRLNPDGTLTPTGGSSMVLFNLEVRLMPSEGFGFVLFSDAGNVRLDQEISLRGLRASYGAGIRYGTPVGPLRIDYGWKIHQRPGESAGELHFNIGHTF